MPHSMAYSGLNTDHVAVRTQMQTHHHPTELLQKQAQHFSRSIAALTGNSCSNFSVLPTTMQSHTFPHCPHQLNARTTERARWLSTGGRPNCIHRLESDVHRDCSRLHPVYHMQPSLTVNHSPHQNNHMSSSPILLHSHGRHRPLSGMYYLGYEPSGHYSGIADEEDDSAFPALQEREFNMLHRQIPALRRTGVDTEGIRQYFYPEGGWGWIVCGIAFVVYVLSSGLQLSYSLLAIYALQHLRNSAGIEWLGAMSWAVSLLCTPLVVAYCRSKSARLLAVVGGLIAPLGLLFTSFATEMGQVVFAYGIVFGVGAAMVRESAAFMLGSYFKRRRRFVEMVAMSGEGVGIALFSVLLKEGVGEAGWRFGLQIMASLLATTFFMGLLYRPASLYHPQRRAIQHLKNQHKKMRENKLPVSVGGSAAETSKTYPNLAKHHCLFLDVSVLRSATVQVLLLAAGVAALGIYAPVFLMSLNAFKTGSDIQDLVLLQTFLGISMVCGVVLAGTLVRQPFRMRQFVVSSAVVSQMFIAIIALSTLFLSFVTGFKSLCALTWTYGIALGGFRYSLKVLALERIKLRQFSKAWGFIRGVESVPVALGVPFASFLNDYSPKYGRAGYYICSAAAAIAAIIIFFINYSTLRTNGGPSNKQLVEGVSGRQGMLCNGGIGTATATCSSAASLHRSQLRSNEDYDFRVADISYGAYSSMDMLHRSCINLQQTTFEDDEVFVRRPCTPRRSSWYERGPMPPFSCHIHRSFQEQQEPRTHQVPMQNYQDRKKICAPRELLSNSRVVSGDKTRRRYRCGQGSVGAYTGRQLQKSLSFIQNPCCCDEERVCKCYKSQYIPYTDPKATLRMPLICTCHKSPRSVLPLHNIPLAFGSNACLHAATKSYSVPEGLAAMSVQCVCQLSPPLPMVKRNIAYLPHHQEPTVTTSTPLVHRSQEQHTQLTTKLPVSSLHFVEQITTSV